MANKGAFILARQLFESEIWLNKPASWNKIWIYILGKVNHKDSKFFKKGEGFFNFSQELKLIGSDITYDNIRSTLHFLKIATMITTSKTTRGIKIKVLNYDKYQDLLYYKTTTPTTTPTTTEPQQNHNRTTMIYNNDNNNNNKDLSSTDDQNALISYWFDKWAEIYGEKPLITNWGRYNRQAKPFIKRFGLDKMKDLCDKYFITTDDFYAKNKWSINIFLTDNVINKLI